MNNTQNTGGPAFPRPFSVDDVDPDISYPAHAGMTLRDYFAAKAMQALMVHPDWNLYPDSTAKDAYKLADAMLKERRRTHDTTQTR